MKQVDVVVVVVGREEFVESSARIYTTRASGGDIIYIMQKRGESGDTTQSQPDPSDSDMCGSGAASHFANTPPAKTGHPVSALGNHRWGKISRRTTIICIGTETVLVQYFDNMNHCGNSVRGRRGRAMRKWSIPRL